MEILQKTGTGSDDSRPCSRLGFFRMMSLARLGLPGLCRSLLRGLCLLVGEHLLLDEHTVGLRGVLLLGHVHAFGTFDWMLGNSRSSRFGTGVSSESMPSR